MTALSVPIHIYREDTRQLSVSQALQNAARQLTSFFKDQIDLKGTESSERVHLRVFKNTVQLTNLVNEEPAASIILKREQIEATLASVIFDINQPTKPSIALSTPEAVNEAFQRYQGIILRLKEVISEYRMKINHLEQLIEQYRFKAEKTDTAIRELETDLANYKQKEREAHEMAEKTAREQAEALRQASSAKMVTPLESPPPPPETAQIAMDPMRQGDLSLFFSYPLQEQIPQIIDQLSTDLNNPEIEDASSVYHTIFFLANCSPESLQSLQASLRTWIIQRALKKDPEERAYQFHVARILSQQPDQALQSLAQPLSWLDPNFNPTSFEERLIQRLLDGTVDPNLSRLDNVRKFYEKGQDPVLRSFIESLIAAKMASLRQNTQYELPSLAKDNPTAPVSWMDQLKKKPELNAHIGKSGLTADQWNKRLEKREKALEEALRSTESPLKDAFLTFDRGAQVILSPAPVVTGNLVTELRGNSYTAEALLENKTTYLNTIKEEIIRCLEKATFLKANEAQEAIIDLLIGAIEKGSLSNYHYLFLSLQNGNGESFFYLMQLLYYYVAISHTDPENRPAFCNFAKDSDWEWLYQDKSPTEKGFILKTILAQFLKDDQLKGSILTAKQVDWVSNIFRALQGQKARPIYDQAGSGKTVTARFAIQLANALLQSNRQLHLLAPFVQSHQGLSCVQYMPNQESITIDQGSDEDIVLVDEGHTLTPYTDIFVGNRSTEPVLMTATPFLLGNHEKERRGETLKDLSRAKHVVGQQSEHLKKTIEALKKEEISQAVENVKKKIDLTPFKDYVSSLPNARQKAAKEIEDISNDSVQLLLTNLQYLITPHKNMGYLNERATPVTLSDVCPHGYSREHTILPKGPVLLDLPKKDYETARQALLKLTNQLIAYKNALKAKRQGQMPTGFSFSSDLSQKIKEQEEWEKEHAAIGSKIQSLQKKIEAPLTESEIALEAYTKTLEEAQTAIFNQFTYQQSESTPFIPQIAIDGISTALKFSEQQPIQFVFPHVRLTLEQIAEIVNGVADVTFIFQHPDTGQKVYFQQGMDAPEALASFDGSGQIVMLYDTTNKQGGDFGRYSNASDSHPIKQHVLFHLTDPERGASTITAYDLYQSLRRRRGQVTSPSIVIGAAPDKETFLALAKQELGKRTRGWAIRQAAAHIANKLSKLHLLRFKLDLFQSYEKAKEKDRQVALKNHTSGLVTIKGLQRKLESLPPNAENVAATLQALSQENTSNDPMLNTLVSSSLDLNIHLQARTWRGIKLLKEIGFIVHRALQASVQQITA